MRNGMRTIATFGAAIIGFALVSPAFGGGIDWECCGLAKPHPTGPMNNCYGYFHTGWRASHSYRP
jgi:hypothetical protein